MVNPEVPEKDRYCGTCTEPVGRSHQGRQGRVDGFCRNCGAEFSFTPKLKPRDLVAGQYEVLGAIAHGGLGWIYLAQDRNVSDRWVVLKGLLNTGDAEAHKAAATERAFLAQVEHPNIVKIINFVQHPDPNTGTPTGHIVMEYVGGRSLKELLSDRRKADGEHARLPLDQVIAYGLETLRALGYLHSKGLLYCDFKPDNVIQSEEQIKLLDLGGVRSIDDADSPVYATPGYRVPEAELLNPGPTISFDLYTVGRSLAVLSFPFSFMREHPHTLPPRETVPLLQLHESFDRFLRRATHADMERRFHDSADMSEQLTGVLREVLATMDGQPRPASSDLFGPEHFVAQSDDPEHLLATPDPLTLATSLPIPLTDAEDAFAGMLSGFAGLSAEELVRRLRAVSKPTTETRLMLTRALISLGNPEEAAVPLDEVEKAHPGDWRTSWYRALIALSAGAYDEAHDRYQSLYDHLPGEAAPKLGLAAAAFGLGKLDDAARYYGLVWNTDYSYVSAAFGLARACLAQGDQAGAVDVLDSVPELSSLYLPAQMAAIVAQVGGGVAGFDPARLTEGHLLNAGQRLELLGLRGEAHNKLAAEVGEAALRWAEAGGSAAPGTVLLNRPLNEDGLRLNLEDSFRGLARSTGDLAERNELIDEANRLRPRTWV